MRFMNTFDIEEAMVVRRDHPTLGPASRSLYNLMLLANRCSDGWCYWPKPVRAAARLMKLIEGDGTWDAVRGPRDDVTPEMVRKAYVPIKSFLTRNQLACTLEDV